MVSMERFTAAERRGALVLIAILLLGGARDGWRALRLPPPARSASPAAAAEPPAAGAEPPPRALATDSRPREGERVDLNRASEGELDRLPGIGPVLAARIVEYRLRHGPFRAVEELRAVRGIGPRLLARLAPRLTVEPTRERPP